MQGVVFIFVAILSVVRAPPFGLDRDRVNRPTLFRNAFRAENAGFYDNSYAEEDEDYSDAIYLEEDSIRKGLNNLFTLLGDLEYCEVDENGSLDVPEEGCFNVAFGGVHFHNVLTRVDVEDVYKVLEDAGVKECDEELSDLPEGGCFYIDEDKGAVDLLVFNTTT